MTVQISAVAEPVLESTDKNALRRKTPTPISKKLQARITGYEESQRSVDSKYRAGHNKPGSQNRSK